MGVWWWYLSPIEQAYTTYGFSVLRKNSSGNPDIRLAAARAMIPGPSATALLGDGDSPASEYPGYPWMNAWLYRGNVRFHPHVRKSNYVFCDGHVESLDETQIKDRPDLFTAY